MNNYDEVNHRKGRPMSRLLEVALDHMDGAFRKQAACVLLEVAEQYGELQAVFTALSLELQLAALRESSLLADLDADLADERHGPG